MPRWQRLHILVRRCVCGSAALAVLAVVLTLPANAQSVSVADIRIEGNDDTETSLILSRFPLTIGDPYNPAMVREGIKALHALGLFDDITVLAEEVPGGVDLILQIEERARISAVRYVGNEHIGTDEITETVVVAKGQLYDPATMSRAARDIVAAYREEGYPLCEVAVDTEDFVEANRVGVTFRVTEGERVRLRKINFLGNEFMPSDDLRGAMKTRPKGFLRSGRFQQEKFEGDLDLIAQHYHNEGYRDAVVTGYDVTYSEDKRDMFVEISVEEGPRYSLEKPTWHGNETVDDELIATLVPWEPGDDYSAEAIRAFSGRISEVFTERGFLLGFGVDENETVLPNHRVQVHYTIREGEPSRVGEVRITGNSHTKEKVIRRQLKIYPGQVFRRSSLMRSQRDVFGLGYFDDVQVDFIPKGAGSNDIDLEFAVQERRLGTAGAGMSYSGAIGISGFLQLGHNNLFGNGWDLNLHLERGANRSQYEISFTEPWLFDRPISLGVELFDSEISRDIFDEARRGAGLTVGWPFPGLDYTRGFNTFRVQDVKFPDIDSSVSDLDRQRLEDTEGTSVSTRFGITRNSTDNPFYPTNGSRSSVNAEYAGGLLGGSIDFQKYRAEHRTYLKPFWKPVLMLRSRLGVVQPYKAGRRVPSNETFRLGGTLFDYLRGYDDYDVVPEENITVDSFGREVRFPGGNYMASFTAELQFPVAHPLHGLFFYDIGNTWNELDDVSLNEFKRGAGAGLRMEVPMLGILGLDYAYGFDRDGGARWKPHVIFGTQF